VRTEEWTLPTSAQNRRTMPTLALLFARERRRRRRRVSVELTREGGTLAFVQVQGDEVRTGSRTGRTWRGHGGPVSHGLARWRNPLLGKHFSTSTRWLAREAARNLHVGSYPMTYGPRDQLMRPFAEYVTRWRFNSSQGPKEIPASRTERKEIRKVDSIIVSQFSTSLWNPPFPSFS